MSELSPCIRCIMRRTLKPVTSLTFKIGGHPVLIEHVAQPHCSDCGQPMQFIAQVPLRFPIGLSRQFDMAYVFVCPGEYDERKWLKCRTWELGSGANCVVLQAGETRQVHEMQRELPELAATYVSHPEPDPDAAEDFESVTGYSHTNMIYEEVKFGGHPVWMQDVECPDCPECGGPMRVVAQIPADISEGDPDRRPSAADILEIVKGTGKRFECPDGIQSRESFSLGYSGIGFVFICEAECGPDGAGFLWQPD